MLGSWRFSKVSTLQNWYHIYYLNKSARHRVFAKWPWVGILGIRSILNIKSRSGWIAYIRKNRRSKKLLSVGSIKNCFSRNLIQTITCPHIVQGVIISRMRVHAKLILVNYSVFFFIVIFILIFTLLHELLTLTLQFANHDFGTFLLQSRYKRTDFQTVFRINF